MEREEYTDRSRKGRSEPSVGEDGTGKMDGLGFSFRFVLYYMLFLGLLFMSFMRVKLTDY